jgi:hypothetical protein
MNLVFFSGLLVSGWLLLSGKDADMGEKEPEPKIEDVKALPLSELAYLQGQMAALREHPATMPPFEESRVREVCGKRLLREATFATLSGDRIESLADQYYRGYKERFDEYFDDRSARELGYSYGLKFDPMIHGAFSRSPASQLRMSRERMEREYGIRDEAEWRLFCEAFQRGFKVGYYVTKEGVTVRSHWEIIRLFEDGTRSGGTPSGH